ncbi:hypothetical protein ACJ72_00564 [Emergomyces africanus]|uniref:Pre-mRNA processing factor 4 (PRP4)-like domain-containing protein n=1 Tax=Emergomyces africanus TaxID=1955775 RepID=A0A1B7P7T9_9EURO|nr:hypothetical protein ACJ72_00564 [Emergomyces africanus]
MHPARRAYVEDAPDDPEMGVDLNNIPVDHDYDMPAAAAGIPPEKASAILSQFSRRRRAAAIAVPTEDGRVRARLRELGHPITLFGEDATDRRDRLREILTDLEEQQEAAGVATGEEGEDVFMKEGAEGGSEEEEEGDEEFYTAGGPELLEARKKIARYSLPRARDRIERQKEESAIPLRTHIKHRKAIKEKLQSFDLYGSQIAGERPVSITRFAPDGQILAAGNWGGGIKLLNVPNLEERATLRGHTDRVGGISWYPGATKPDSNVSASSVNLASGGGEGNVHLWSLTQDTPVATLSGHSGRVCRVEFHPSGEYLASASYDTTWRLWDVATSTELLLQEGHSREVYSLAFNPDGSLLASGGLDSFGRIWDLRTGRTVMILEGTSERYMVWIGVPTDIVRCTGGVGAHRGVVSDLRWYKGTESTSSYLPSIPLEDQNGDATDGLVSLSTPVGGQSPVPPQSVPVQPKKSGTFFVSSGFDKNVNVFSADDWSLVKSLSGHSGNVLSVDVSDDVKWIASCGHDRTVKLWGIDR